jgi:hypothetical protein
MHIMSDSKEHDVHQNERSEPDQGEVKRSIGGTSDSTPSSRLAQSQASFDHGDFKRARAYLKQIDEEEVIDDQDKTHYLSLKSRLTTDPAEYIFPAVLFIFWFILAYRTV